MSAQPSFFSDDFADYIKRLIREALRELQPELRNQLIPPYNSLSGDPKKVYSRRQVAEIIGRSENSVTKYIKQRKLHATCLNGIYYISQSDLINFINGTKNGKN